MPAQIKPWTVAHQSVCCIELAGKWTWEELEDAYDGFVEMANQSQEKIYLVYDASNNAGVPANALVQASKLVQRLPENTGLVIVSGPNILIRRFAEIMTRLNKGFGAKVRFTGTLDDTVKVIDDHMKMTA